MNATLQPLAVAALNALSEKPMHPYEMYQMLLSRREDRLVKLRPGTLYHAINRLEDGGYIRSVGVDREGRRPERTTYEVTDAGRGVFHEWVESNLADPKPEYPIYPLAVSEAHNLTCESAVEAFEQRIAGLEEQRGELTEGVESLEVKKVPERYWIDVTYSLKLIDAELDWLRSTVRRMTAGHLTWA